MKKNDFNIAGLDLNAAKTLSELNERQAAGEKLDPGTEEALEAVRIASNIVNSIMSGKQVDVAFLKHVVNLAKLKINMGQEKDGPKKVKKKKKLYKKD